MWLIKKNKDLCGSELKGLSDVSIKCTLKPHAEFTKHQYRGKYGNATWTFDGRVYNIESAKINY